MGLRHLPVLLLPLLTTLALIVRWMPELHGRHAGEVRRHHHHHQQQQHPATAPLILEASTPLPQGTHPSSTAPQRQGHRLPPLLGATTTTPATLDGLQGISAAAGDTLRPSPSPSSPQALGTTGTAGSSIARPLYPIRDSASLGHALDAAAAGLDLDAPWAALAAEQQQQQQPTRRSNATCSGPPNRTPRRIEYPHRRRRGGELGNAAFLQALQDDPAVDRVVLLLGGGGGPRTGGYPAVVNTSPVNLNGAAYNISKPFGRWRAKFLQKPRDDLLRLAHAQPDQPGLLKEPQFFPWQPPAYVAVFRDTWVGRGYAILCDRMYGTGACLWEAPKGVPAVFRNYDVGAVVCDSWCGGYFHWTHEHLPRVALIAAALRQNREMKLVLPVKAGFQSDFLSLLGVAKSQLLRPGDYRFARLLFPQPQRCGNVFAPTLYIMRREILRALRLPASFNAGADWTEGAPGAAWSAATPTSFTGDFTQVVLAERKKGSRMPSNYQAVRSRLALDYPKLRFKCHLGRPVAEQIKLFNSAWIVFGPHGANLANILFARLGGGHLIEMISYNVANLCYYTTAVRVGMTYHMVPFRGGGAYVVNYTEVASHFDLALDDARAKWRVSL